MLRAVVSEQSMIDAVPRGEYVPTADQRVVMYGLSCKDFEAFIEIRGLDAGHASWRSPKTRDGDRRKRAMAITENAASRSPKTRIAIGGRTNPA